eukprot:427933-Pleurochrysis_carterae.AAC.2
MAELGRAAIWRQCTKPSAHLLRLSLRAQSSYRSYVLAVCERAGVWKSKREVVCGHLRIGA